MTELRASPGEILESVAAKGRSYLVERKGDLLACIVPVELFMPNIAPSVIHEQLAALEDAQEKASLAFTKSKMLGAHQLEFRFAASMPSADGTGEDLGHLRVVLPSGYPDVVPSVFISQEQESDDKEAPTSLLRSDAPHINADGSIDLLPALDSIPDEFTVLFTLNAARRWLGQYRRWLETGEWPTNPGEHHDKCP